MIFSERISLNKQNVNPAAKKKFINIVDQESNELLLRLAIHPCLSISTLKQKLQKKIGGGGSIGKIRLRYKQQILINNNASIADYNIKHESEIYYTPLLQLESVGMIRSYDNDPRTVKEMAKVLSEIRKGLHNKIIPKLTDSGISGSYFIENIERNYVAIFKPLDEEPYAPNNPKGYVGKLGQKGIRQGIRSGEQGYREVVAYLLDSKGFHQVPPTSFVEFYHPAFKFHEKIENLDSSDIQMPSFIGAEDSKGIQVKLQNESKLVDQIKRGSLQMFVRHNDECGNYGNSIFSIDEVHKIAILDIRILNCDRNDQNILVKKKKKKCKSFKKIIREGQLSAQELQRLPSYKAQLLEYDFNLIPIDHGLSLPDSFEICWDNLNWMWWDQSEQPFSKRSLDFIRDISIEKDLKILESKFNLREKCLRNFRIASITLKEGAKIGLTLNEIGKILYRPDIDEESVIEKLIKEVEHYAAICMKGGNSDIIKNKIQKDIARNKIKQGMSSIPENTILEQTPLNEQDENEEAESPSTPKRSREVDGTSKQLNNHPSSAAQLHSENSTGLSSNVAMISPTSFSSSSSQNERAQLQQQQQQSIQEYQNTSQTLNLKPQQQQQGQQQPQSNLLTVPSDFTLGGQFSNTSQNLDDFIPNNTASAHPHMTNLPSLNQQTSQSSTSSFGSIFKLKRSFSLPELESAKMNEKNVTPSEKESKLHQNGSDSKRSVAFQLTNVSSNPTEDTSQLNQPSEHNNQKGPSFQKQVSLALKPAFHKKQQEKKVLEDIFFYYFDQVLQSHFEKILSEKQKTQKSTRGRGRFNSEEMSTASLAKYS